MKTLLVSNAAESSTVLGQRLRREGYLFFRAALDAKKMLRARKAVLAICRRFGWLASSSDELTARFDVERWLEAQSQSEDARSRFLEQWSACIREWTETPAYRAVHEDAALRRLLARSLGGPVVQHPLREARGARIGFPRVCRIGHGAHQDHNYLKDPEAAYTVWLPAGRCPRGLGGLALWPRSQARGYLHHDGPRGIPDANLRNVKWASEDYEMGDVLVFGMLTVHRALPNLTPDTLRFSLDFRYCKKESVSEGLLQNPDYGNLSFPQVTSKNGVAIRTKRR